MDEFESIDDESPDRYSPSRRSVLKAIGVTAIAGGAFTGTAFGQEEECPALELEFEYTSEGWVVSKGDANILSVSGDARTMTITNDTSNCDYEVSLQAKGGQCTSDVMSATLGPGESISFKSSDFGDCTAGRSGQNPDLSNVKGTAIGTPRNGGGEECPTTKNNKFEWNGQNPFDLEVDSNGWVDLGIEVTASDFKAGEPDQPIAATWTSPYPVDVVSVKADVPVEFSSTGCGTSGEVRIAPTGSGGSEVKAISNIEFNCC